ncbi:pentapeptide repeat-containing protein [Phormidium sp. LEGE 05292]|uniref:pentapeptide repeat-containing protein n=1 Tax=[Phormidium] sp. LEGE 05292 TaxID=767427 RepID=UPI00187FC60E|nr:pentapeptide repeat-containing protein [Phormidium sp. LEGE 05292]MBE9225021.1 pentapeptide repeat-containing protein [Phormidium sp. LEGE 05292]
MANWLHSTLLWMGVNVWNSWRKNFPDIEPDLYGINLNGANLKGVNFSGANLGPAGLFSADLQAADLTGAYLNGACLNRANLSEAKLSGALLRAADLTRANLTGANLSGAYLNRADLSTALLRVANLAKADLTGAFLRGAYLTGANLRGAYLSRADFSGTYMRAANLSEADLTAASFKEADLTAAFLIRTQALYTNFNKAKFTGACIQDWNINSATLLDDIFCDYIYLQYHQQERRPIIGEFVSGEFSKLFHKVFATVDLIFLHGIEWQALSLALEKFNTEMVGNEIAIQAIEQRLDGAFVIRFKVPCETDKAKIEKLLKLQYELALRDIDNQYGEQLQSQSDDIAIHRQQGANLMEIAKTMANRPIDLKSLTNSENFNLSESALEDDNQNNHAQDFYFN